MLGVHFAIDADQERLLLAAADSGDTDAVSDLVEDVEENWTEPGLSVSTDKAWEAMHRCLGDGTLDPDGGAYPLSHAILGGRYLHDEDYGVYVSAAEAEDMAQALRQVNEAWLRQRRLKNLDIPSACATSKPPTASTLARRDHITVPAEDDDPGANSHAADGSPGEDAKLSTSTNS